MGKNNNDGRERTRFAWWIGMARYAVAALVTTITVVVIARAVVVSLRSEKLYISVANATVSLVNYDDSTTPPKVWLSLIFQSRNPSGRVGISYTGVHVSILHSNSSLITSFRMPDDDMQSIVVGPLFELMSQVSVPYDLSEDEEVLAFVVDTVRNGTPVPGAVVLDGTLHTQISGLRYTKGNTAQFRCTPVTIGDASHLPATTGDASCKEV